MNNGFNNFNYGMYYGFNPEYLFRKEEEKKKLRRLGIYAGASVLVYLLIQYAFVILLAMMGLTDKYYSDPYFSSAFDIILVIFSTVPAFAIFGKKMKEVSSVREPIPLGKPYKAWIVVPAVVAGVGACMLGNIVSNYVSAIFSSVNMELSSPEMVMPEGISGIILNLFRVAVVAAVIEEISYRGVVMGNLRYFGDGFAITVSSIVFALVHGNLVQAPMALVAGFAMGYLSLKTGTLWTGVIIHFINNSFSVIVYYASEYFGEDAIAVPYALFVYGLIALGIGCFVLVSQKTKYVTFSNGASILTGSEKSKAFFFSWTMILTIIYMLFTTAQYINA